MQPASLPALGTLLAECQIYEYEIRLLADATEESPLMRKCIQQCMRVLMHLCLENLLWC